MADSLKVLGQLDPAATTVTVMAPVKVPPDPAVGVTCAVAEALFIETL